LPPRTDRDDVIAVVVSRADSASEHVGEHLLDAAEWTERTDPERDAGAGGGTYYRREGFELRTFDALHLDLDGVADAFDADPSLLVFVSRHSGETGPLLSAHFTGNFGAAEYGGSDRALARAAPNAQARVVERLAAHAPDGYEVAVECTHHGPTDVGAPSMFVELGSGPDEWADPAGAAAVARAVLDLEDVAPDRQGPDGRPRHVVGFGGGHYAPRFDRLLRETAWAVGHVAADWQLDAMGPPRENRAVVDLAFRESDAEYAVVDGDHPVLAEVIADLGYRVVSETWVREVGAAPLDLVETVESRLSTVDAGLRLGDVRPDPAAVRVVALPDDLVAAAESIDREATREAVAARTAAFETAENGNRIAGDAAVADPRAYEALVAGLADLLRRRYDEVTREDGVVVARERRFDPEKARTLGIPEGPAFGRLAGGEAVEVDGETIRPETVRSERVERFPVGDRSRE
jgi:D-aminoacyl-tRNA deacylase